MKQKFEIDERYYYLTPNGDTHSDVWRDDDIDNMLVEVGNIFKTKEEAKFQLEKIKVYNALKNYADEYNEKEIMREDYPCVTSCNKCRIGKRVIRYDYMQGRFELAPMCVSQDIGQIYFSSEEIAKNAIKVVGENRIKKYLFGVDCKENNLDSKKITFYSIISQLKDLQCNAERIINYIKNEMK